MTPAPPPACGSGDAPLCPLATLSGLTITPARFRAARVGVVAAGARHKPVGARVSFRLSSSSSVRFTILSVSSGRRAGGRCVRKTRADRHTRACTLLLTRASFTRAGKSGANAFTLSGRISRRRSLAAGRYRLSAAAFAGHQTGKVSVKAFRIVR